MLTLVCGLRTVEAYSSCGFIRVWVFSELRTLNWQTGTKTWTVCELSQWLAVMSVITWHMVCTIPMTITLPRLSKQRTSNYDFCNVTSLGIKILHLHQISSKSDDPRPRHSNKTIFKMAAVHHLEFFKFGIWSSNLCQTWSCFFILNFALIAQ